jgi:hypothetical protein
MVNQPVTHQCLMDDTRLRVAHREPLVAAVAVDRSGQLVPQGKKIIGQIPLERLDVGLAALASSEFFPRKA